MSEDKKITLADLKTKQQRSQYIAVEGYEKFAQLVAEANAERKARITTKGSSWLSGK
jgi:hypothetical protein